MSNDPSPTVPYEETECTSINNDTMTPSFVLATPVFDDEPRMRDGEFCFMEYEIYDTAFASNVKLENPLFAPTESRAPATPNPTNDKPTRPTRPSRKREKRPCRRGPLLPFIEDETEASIAESIFQAKHSFEMRQMEAWKQL